MNRFSRIKLFLRRVNTAKTYWFSYLINEYLFTDWAPVKGPIKRLTVIKLDNAGDVVLSSLFMPYIAERFKDINIVYVVKEGMKDLLSPLDCISDVLEVPFGRGHCSEAQGEMTNNERFARSMIKKHLKEFRPQMIIDLRATSIGNFTALAAWLLGTRYRVTLDLYRIKEIIGNKTEKEAKWDRHEAETFYLALRDAGIFPDYHDYRNALSFWTPPGNSSQDISCGWFVLEKERVILIQPGAVWEYKRWPDSYYIHLINSMTEQTGKVLFILIGTRDEKDICLKVYNGLDKPARDRTINMAGETSLRELIVLINRAELVIANDSGVAHIAGALDVDTVVFFGPSAPSRFAPLSLHQDKIKVFHHTMECCPCDQLKCRHAGNNYCLSHISPEAVENYLADKFYKKLNERKRPEDITV